MGIKLAKAFKPLIKPKRFKVIKGGRGSGKSTHVAIILLLKAMEKKLRILCAREVQNSISDSVHKLLSDIINNNPEFSAYKITQNSIRYPNGSEFLFKGLKHNIQDIKSTESIDICWVEEAQSVSAISWDVLVPTVRNENSEIWITFNPDLEDDPTYIRFVKNADYNDFLVLTVNYDQNPFLSDTLKAEMERDKKRDYANYLHVWEGEFRQQVQAAVFTNWRIEDLALSENDFLFGADWGFANDPDTLVRVRIDGKLLYIDYASFGYHIEIDDTPEFYKTVPRSDEYVIRADNARPEMIAHMKKKGFKIQAAKKWPGSIEDGIKYLQGFDIVIHPRCTKIIEEFAKYSYKVHRLTGDILPEIVDDYNHGIDALRYAIEPLIKRKASGFFNRRKK